MMTKCYIRVNVRHLIRAAPGWTGDRPALGEWDRVEVSGGLMEETECYPPHYRVRGFPDDAALEAIGKGEL
jgi:hypothetical protein